MLLKKRPKMIILSFNIENMLSDHIISYIDVGDACRQREYRLDIRLLLY